MSGCGSGSIHVASPRPHKIDLTYYKQQLS